MKNFNRDDRNSNKLSADRQFNGNFKRKGFHGGGFENRQHHRGERQEMFRAICADCGSPCEVPFKPSGGRPVLCSSCFKGTPRADKPQAHDNGRLDEKFNSINYKLDKIIELLGKSATPDTGKETGKTERKIEKKATKKPTKKSSAKK